MRFIEYAAKLETIKYLSEHRRTGTPQCLAQKLDVFKGTLQRMVCSLREQGFDISFNRSKGSYEAKKNKINFCMKFSLPFWWYKVTDLLSLSYDKRSSLN